MTRDRDARLLVAVWRNTKTDQLITENTVVIYSYIPDAKKFTAELNRIALMYHDFGVSARQDMLALEFHAGTEQRMYWVPPEAD